MAHEDHEQLADELEREADKLAREGERVDSHITHTREGWQRKQRDPGVPGATGDIPAAEERSSGSESDSESG